MQWSDKHTIIQNAKHDGVRKKRIRPTYISLEFPFKSLNFIFCGRPHDPCGPRGFFFCFFFDVYSHLPSWQVFDQLPESLKATRLTLRTVQTLADPKGNSVRDQELTASIILLAFSGSCLSSSARTSAEQLSTEGRSWSFRREVQRNWCTNVLEHELQKEPLWCSEAEAHQWI